MNNNSPNRVSIKNLRPLDFAIIGIAIVIAGFLLVESVKPFLAERHFREGYYLMQKNFPRFAIVEMKEAMELAPWEPRYALHLGKAYELAASRAISKESKIENLMAAEKLFQTIVRLDRQNPWYLNRLSYVYNQLATIDPEHAEQHQAKSLDYVRQAAAVDKFNPLFQVGYAQMLHRQGKFDEAAELYQQVVDWDPNMLEASYNLGDLAGRRGSIDAAIQYYESVYKANPDFLRTRQALSRYYLQLGQPEKAIPFLEEEAQKDPRQLNTYHSLAVAYSQAGRHDDAIRLCDQLLNVRPDFFGAVQVKVFSLHKLGKKQQARAEVNAYIAKYPNHKGAKALLKQIN
ncbi:MAG: tetratricopeptide repeat protein [bacterium]|nr:tetratricopeptide repeat protein [bacterium]